MQRKIRDCSQSISFVLIPKTIILQMNKINRKHIVQKLSNQLSNIAVNIYRLQYVFYLRIPHQPRLPCTIRLRCIMGPSDRVRPHICLSQKEKLFCSSGKTLKLNFNVYFLRGKTEYQALEEGRRQPRTEPRIVRYLKIISSGHNTPLSIY